MRQYSKLPRLYVPNVTAIGQNLDLPQTQTHYLGTVMRLTSGAQIRVFNDDHGEYLAGFTLTSKRRSSINIIQQLRPPKPAPDIWLLFAPVKKHRNHFIVEKATELGAALIQPVRTARTTCKIRIDKMQAQIIEAAEQTERLDLPQVRRAVKLETLLQNWDEARTLIFADEAGIFADEAKDAGPAVTAQNTIEVLAKIKAPAAVLVGPQGGFTPQERALLRRQAYVTPISLGPRILRADTAVVAVLALWQAVSGDW